MDLESPAVRIERVRPDMAASVLPMFERYRGFYGREPDSRAEAFLWHRLERDQSVVFIAAPEAAPEQAAGFAQLYPSYSSLSLASTWILNDLYVEPASLGFQRETGFVHYTIDLPGC